MCLTVCLNLKSLQSYRSNQYTNISYAPHVRKEQPIKVKQFAFRGTAVIRPEEQTR